MPDKKTPAEVEYEPVATMTEHLCEICDNFRLPMTCTKVAGQISPLGWCNLWANQAIAAGYRPAPAVGLMTFEGRNDATFNESDHPRDADGKFGSGGGDDGERSEDIGSVNPKIAPEGSIEQRVMPFPGDTYVSEILKAAEKSDPDWKYAIKEHPFQEVPKNKIVSVQPWENAETVEAYRKEYRKNKGFQKEDVSGKPVDHSPLAFKYNGKFYILSGNHRTSAAIQEGAETVKMRVFGESHDRSDAAIEVRPDAVANESGPLAAAGVLFVAGDKVLLMHRKDGFWGLPGGKLEPGESAQDAAAREAEEETGRRPTDLQLWTRRVKDGVDFSTYLSRIDEPFEPRYNDEHDAHEWAPILDYVSSSMDELGL